MFQNFLKSLWNGDEGLAKTYWIYGVVIGNIGFKALTIAGGETSNNLFLTAVFLNAVYMTFILPCIWKSATKYEGSKIWSILAKILVVLGAFNVLVLFTVVTEGLS